jgi:hypothetical protein
MLEKITDVIFSVLGFLAMMSILIVFIVACTWISVALVHEIIDITTGKEPMVELRTHR